MRQQKEDLGKHFFLSVFFLLQAPAPWHILKVIKLGAGNRLAFRAMHPHLQTASSLSHTGTSLHKNTLKKASSASRTIPCALRAHSQSQQRHKAMGGGWL